MKKDKKLMEQVQEIFTNRGQKAFNVAKSAILQEKIRYKPIYDTLLYFMEESWHDVQHPALLSLTCEAVGGNPDVTTQIGAAMVLLAGAADIHDDIIDKSKIKGCEPTVFGKFGADIALLAGDALLFKGSILLHSACKKLPEKTGQIILDLVKQAFFELGNAEAREAEYFKKKYDVTPEEYRKVIEMKATVAEANARIGAILGGGNVEEIDLIGNYGRTLGILMAIRDDFIDLFEPNELRNRAKNECLPLPILYAFKNPRKKIKIVQLLRKNKITKQKTREILDLIMDAKEVQQLRKEMWLLIKREKNSLCRIKRNKNTLSLLLQSILEDL